MHIGKLPAALPLLVTDFRLSLVQAGNLVSIYAVLIASGGLLCGFFVVRFGYVLFATIGVGLCLLGSLAGAYADTVPILMLTRAVEGLGWVMGVVSIPVIMSTLSTDKDRPVVMGLWGAFMAVGAGTMLLVAPQLQLIGGWRLSWFVAAGFSGVGSIAVLIVCHAHRDGLKQLKLVRTRAPSVKSNEVKSIPSGFTLSNALQALRMQILAITIDLRTRGSVAVLMCFSCYSLLYVCVTSFLPTLLVQDSGMSLSIASFWTAFIIFPNAIGNVCAGWLINRGFRRSSILGTSAVLIGICSFVTLAVPDTTIRIGAALLMTGIGGIIPGALFSTAALLASSAAGFGVVIGFMLTGTGLGQLAGPVLLTRLVEWSGHWYVGGVLCVVVAGVGTYFARWLRFIPATTTK